MGKTINSHAETREFMMNFTPFRRQITPKKPLHMAIKARNGISNPPTPKIFQRPASEIADEASQRSHRRIQNRSLTARKRRIRQANTEASFHTSSSNSLRLMKERPPNHHHKANTAKTGQTRQPNQSEKPLNNGIWTALKWMSAYKVKHYMTKEIPTIDSSSSVSEAAKVMEKAGRGFLIVLKELRPTGIVTERDFVNKVMAHDLDPKRVIISEIMTSPLITIDPDDDLQKASELMQKHNIRRIPVVKEGIIYGVITSVDITLHLIDYVNQATKDIIRWAIPFGR